MRVLFLYPRALDPSKSVGGVAEFLYGLTPALKSLDISPVIYAGNKQNFELKGPTFLDNDIPIFTGPFIRPGFFISKKRLLPLLKVCKELNITVSHPQGTYSAGFAALQIYKHLKIPYVVTSHSDILTTNSRRVNRFSVRHRCRNVLKHAGAVTHLTPMMESASHLITQTLDKSWLIGNGIDCQKWLAYHALPEKNYFLSIGRLEPGKGTHILIAMFEKFLKQTSAQTSLMIAGMGTAEKALHDQAKRLGCEVYFDFCDFDHIPPRSILFTGYVRGENKLRLMAQAKVILIANQPRLWEEAFPIVQLEAMAAGRAIIASDTEVTRYLQQEGMQALTVKADEVDDWVASTIRLMDDELRSALGNKNKTYAQKFDWLSIARKYRDVYLSLDASRKQMQK